MEFHLNPPPFSLGFAYGRNWQQGDWISFHPADSLLTLCLLWRQGRRHTNRQIAAKICRNFTGALRGGAGGKNVQNVACRCFVSARSDGVFSSLKLEEAERAKKKVQLPPSYLADRTLRTPPASHSDSPHRWGARRTQRHLAVGAD